MVVPRLISVTPTSGNAAGGETITIVGMDIDAAATVDFRLCPTSVLVPAAAVVQFINFPNNLQHLSVTTPAIPTQSGIVGDLTFFDRSVTIRVTNPPLGEYSELHFSWNARFIDHSLTFTEIGKVLFYPERLNTPIGGGELFETFTAGSSIWRQTYEFVPSVAGVVDYKAYGEFDIRPLDPRHNSRKGAFGHPRVYSPFVTRGKILKVVLQTFLGSAAGWSVTLKDDMGVDALQGLGAAAGPAAGGSATFISAKLDSTGQSQKIALNDHMRFGVTGTGVFTAPTYGLVHVYLGLE